jgi:hypothetical protein
MISARQALQEHSTTQRAMLSTAMTTAQMN